MHQPHSATHTDDAGFSLTEVLAAVFIVAVASTFIVLTGPKQPDALARQGKSVSALLSKSVDEAMITGETYGLSITEAGYQPIKWVAPKWQAATDDVIPHEPDVRLAQSNVQKKLGLNTSTALSPAFTMDPTGYASGAPVTFEFGNDTLTLSITNAGEVKQERTNEHRF
ncbi:MAG: prepilin-type N-terminal cleavage/methylation domain-containing protein [Hyphomonas sp.]